MSLELTQRIRRILRNGLVVRFELCTQKFSEELTAVILVAPPNRSEEGSPIDHIHLDVHRDNTYGIDVVRREFTWIDDKQLATTLDRWAKYSIGGKPLSFVGALIPHTRPVRHRVPLGSPLWQFYLGWLNNEFAQDSFGRGNLSSADRECLLRRFTGLVTEARAEFNSFMGV